MSLNRMKLRSLVLVLLSLICCFYMVCTVVHGKVETTKELLLGAAGNSVHLGGTECGKGKENNVDCKLQGKGGGAAQESVLDEDYIYTNSLP